MNRIPIYALNIPREFISVIGDKGWDALSEKTRQMIGTPAPATPAYREMMLEVFAQHQAHGAHGVAPAEDVAMSEEDKQKADDALKTRQNNFIQGQLAWDRAMAEVLKKVVEKDDIDLVIGVMGAGHIIPKMAVPYQLAKLDEDDVLSLMPWDDTMPCEEFSSEMAQYVFGVDKNLKFAQKKGEPKPHKPAILGVFLEKAEDGILISRIVENSIAASAGLEKDDILIEAAGQPMKEVIDVVRVVRAMAPGTWLPLKVKRVNQTIQFVAKFPVN